MWSKHLLLGLTGLTSGLAVSAGTFALVVTLRIMPRIIGKSNTADQVIRYENMIIAGGIFGNIVTVFPDLRIPLGSPFVILYGLCSGIQVGCLVLALAENHGCISDHVPPHELKNRYGMGDHGNGSRKGSRWALLFLSSDGKLLKICI